MNVIVSVIVPIFNKETWLSKCIDSILAQTYKNIEVLLIDDGSNDKSSIICDRYAEYDNRIVVIHKKNGGVSSARNEGIKISKGDYIAFIDADDYLERTYIEHLIQFTGFDIITNSLQKEESEFIGNDIKYYVDSFGRSVFGTSSCFKLYKSNLIKDNGIIFPINIRYGEDTLFNLELLRVCETIKIIPYIEYHYRFIAPGRYCLTANQIEEKIVQLRNAYDKLSDRFNYKYDLSYDIKMTIAIFSIDEILKKGDNEYFNLYVKYFPSKNIKDLYTDPICSPLYRAITTAKDAAIAQKYNLVKSILRYSITCYANIFRKISKYPYKLHYVIGYALGYKLYRTAYFILLLYGKIKRNG